MYLTQNEDDLVKYVSTLYQHIFVITTILNEIRNLLGVNGHCTKHMYDCYLIKIHTYLINTDTFDFSWRVGIAGRPVLHYSRIRDIWSKV
jgi:hypothetical protein